MPVAVVTVAIAAIAGIEIFVHVRRERHEQRWLAAHEPDVFARIESALGRLAESEQARDSEADTDTEAQRTAYEEFGSQVETTEWIVSASPAVSSGSAPKGVPTSDPSGFASLRCVCSEVVMASGASFPPSLWKRVGGGPAAPPRGRLSTIGIDHLYLRSTWRRRSPAWAVAPLVVIATEVKGTTARRGWETTLTASQPRGRHVR